MATEKQPYISHEPGDPITSEDWNAVQEMIKEDICNTVDAAKEEIREGSVKEAGNAEKFDNKTEKEWKEALDERYASKVHDHEGMASYRRYIKSFTDDLKIALLNHDLGRFPLVDVYELRNVVGLNNGDGSLDDIDEEYKNCKLFVYYGHREAEKYRIMGNVYRKKVKMGLPLEKFLEELAVQYEDDNTLGDVLNDMLDAFMEDPNDEIAHCRSQWIKDSVKERRTVDDLKQADEWADLYVAIAPRQVRSQSVEQSVTGENGIEVKFSRRVEVIQGNYETLLVHVGEPETVGVTDVSLDVPPLDIMVLLRS